MAEPATATADAPSRSPDASAPGRGEASDGGDLLASLARAGVATHAVGFATDERASLTDEALALEALAALVEGQIFRIAPLRYAVRIGGDSGAADALAAALAQALRGAAPTVTRLEAGPAPDDGEAAELLRAFAAPAAAPLRVMDAEAAVAAAERTAARIAALSAPDPALDKRLERIEAALDALAARPAADPETLAARIAELTPRPEPAPAPEPHAGPAGRLDAIDATLERLAALLPQTVAAGCDALAARLDGVEAALERLSASGATAGGVAALRDDIGALAASWTADGAPAREADALRDMADTLQAALARLDVVTDQLAAAGRQGSDAAPLAAVLARLDGVEAALTTKPPADALAAAVAALAEAMQGFDPSAALSALREDVRALAMRPAPALDLRAEREALHRSVLELQTLMARIDAEIAQQTGGEARRDAPPQPQACDAAPTIDGPGAPSADAALIERIGTTLAELLAQLRRGEAPAAARRDLPPPASGGAP